MKKLIALSILALGTFSSASAQQENISSKQLIQNIADSLFYGANGYEKTKAFSGAEVGISWHDSIYYFSYGYANKEKQVKSDTSTIFEIGSNTKIFTSLLLAHEMNAGSINAETKIDEYLPVNKEIANRVRIADLATFTSGLPTLHDSAAMAELNQVDSVQPLAHVDNNYLLSLLGKTTMLKGYGQYEYSNYSYSLLGYLLSKLSCKSYDHLLNDRVLKPLQLRNTTTTVDTDDSHIARGYDGSDPAPYMQLTGMAPAGILKSNVTDMMHFVQYQLGKSSTISEDINLSQKKFYTNDSLGLSVGLGWHISNHYNDDVYVMRGDTYGFSSLMAFDKNEKIGIVILGNTVNPEEMERSFIRIFRKIKEGTSEYKKKLEQPTVTLNDDVLNRYAGTYQIAPDFLMNVSVDSGKIYVQCTNQPKGLIEPINETTFTAKKYGAEFEFVKDNAVAYNEVILRQNGQVIKGVKKP